MSLTALIAAGLLQAAAPAPDLSWMAGYWLDCSRGREASETWTDPRGGVIVGAAVTLRDSRVGFEHARIAPVDGLLSYVAQPEGIPPTVFPLLEVTEGRAVFQNLENDFPQRVIYQRIGDVLTARIEGRMDGRDQSADWRFDRTELNTRCPTP